MTPKRKNCGNLHSPIVNEVELYALDFSGLVDDRRHRELAVELREVSQTVSSEDDEGGLSRLRLESLCNFDYLQGKSHFVALNCYKRQRGPQFTLVARTSGSEVRGSTAKLSG